MAQDQPTLQPPDQPDHTPALVEALERLLDYAELQVCAHDNTYRGGAIWEICECCGAKWADDEGGKPPFEWPEEIQAARALLAVCCPPPPPMTKEEYDEGMRFILAAIRRNNPKEIEEVQALADRLVAYEEVHFPIPPLFPPGRHFPR